MRGLNATVLGTLTGQNIIWSCPMSFKPLDQAVGAKSTKVPPASFYDSAQNTQPAVILQRPMVDYIDTT
jgi:hypothetical protein